MDRLVYELDPVLAFMREHQPLAACEGMQAIGFERDGHLVAGVAYEGFNGRNIWMHVAAEPGGKWLTRRYMHACFAYPFIQLGVDAVRGYVDESNERALKFDQHLGFKPEARLHGAARDGGDVLILVLRREECRYA